MIKGEDIHKIPVWLCRLELCTLFEKILAVYKPEELLRWCMCSN